MLHKIIQYMQKNRSVLYQSTFVPLTSIAATNGNTQALSPMFTAAFQSSDGLAGFINALFLMSISIGAILAVLRIAYAGFLYMGSDMISSKHHAKEILGEAVLGLLLLLSVYLILSQINPQILNLSTLKTNISNSPASGQGGTPAASTPATNQTPGLTDPNTSPVTVGSPYDPNSGVVTGP